LFDLIYIIRTNEEDRCNVFGDGEASERIEILGSENVGSLHRSKRIDIVCFSDVYWDSIWHRHQNILTRFPDNWNILFIEPTSLPTLLKRPKHIFLRREKNIIIASLPSLPLIDRIKELRWLNDYLILLWLHLLLKLTCIKRPVLLYYEPRFSSLIKKLNELLVIYDCIDDKLAFSSVPKWMKIYLDNLIDNAHLIFVTSSNLYRKIAEKRKDNVYMIGNGVDPALFKKAMMDIAIPKDVKEVKKPIVGYVGTIDDWLDFSLVRAFAKAYPGISFVFLGPVIPKVKKEIKILRKFHNIFIIGEKPHKMLPNYLKAFDVCIIPFKINELTISVNPVKFYEYLASGKNVVSTALPEIERYKEILYMARDEREFIDNIGLALSTAPDTDKFSRVVDEHRWDRKAGEMAKLILKYLNKIHWTEVQYS